jgi:hypothetical protein
MGDEHGHIPDETFLVIRDGRTSSPRTLDQLIALAEAGKLRPDDEIMQNIMGSPMPIGTAGEQPWYPGSAPPDVILPMPEAAAAPRNQEPLLKAILTDRTWQIRIGVASAVLVIAAGVALAMRSSSKQAERELRAEIERYETDLQSRYRALKQRVDRYRTDQSEPHALVQDLDHFIAVLKRPKHELSPESAGIALLVSDMRAEVWGSRTRLSTDLVRIRTLTTNAEAHFKNDDVARGTHELSLAEALLAQRPPKLPEGISEGDLQAAERRVENAKAERNRVLALAAQREREAEEARRAEAERQAAAARAAQEAAYHREMLAKGFVLHKGQWITREQLAQMPFPVREVRQAIQSQSSDIAPLYLLVGTQIERGTDLEYSFSIVLTISDTGNNQTTFTYKCSADLELSGSFEFRGSPTPPFIKDRLWKLVSQALAQSRSNR